MPQDKCKICGNILDKDEIAVYKRMVNRGATEYMCIKCFAIKFEVTEKAIKDKIEHFKKMGCTLFDT